MQSELLKELLQSVNIHLLTLIFQFVLAGLVLMSLKDFSVRILDYIKLKFSDFGRGTKIETLNYIGYISRITFSEVEIVINDQRTLIVPVNDFIKANKVIIQGRWDYN